MGKRPHLKAVGVDEPAPKVVDLTAPEATHHELAQAYLMELELASGQPPVGSGNAIYTVGKSGLWQPKTQDTLSLEIGKSFCKHKNAKTVSHYRAIASHATSACDAPEFFTAAPAGVVCPSGFWTIDSGSVKSRLLTPDDRQRFALGIDPDFDAEPVLFQRLLDHALDPPQQALLMEGIGAALMRLMSVFQLVLALYGAPASGKSVIQRIVERLFPPSSVTSIGPHRWGHEYYLAALAHARLNLVGELPDDSDIPAAPFKQVTGGDLLSARDPAHRPFFFRSEAAHLFNLNTLPMHKDRSEGFYRRWRFVHFLCSVPPNERDPRLADKIIESELPAVLAMALKGAERAARLGTLSTTPTHEAVMVRWRIASNPVLLFLTDADYCQITGDSSDAVQRTLVYAAYRRWAGENGNRPMSAQAFYRQIDESAGRQGVFQTRRNDAEYLLGLRLAPGPVPSQGGIW